MTGFVPWTPLLPAFLTAIAEVTVAEPAIIEQVTAQPQMNPYMPPQGEVSSSRLHHADDHFPLLDTASLC